MSSKGNEKKEFPKNIRQIGEAGKEKRIYLEDYAITFLRQVQGAVLLGETERIRGVRCYFISGAIEVPEGNFDEENWKYVAKEAEESFQGLSVMGWFLKTEEIPEELDQEDMRVYKEHFPGKEAILVVYNDLEKEEAVYLTVDGFLRKQNGYYIYYEKNQQMQEYLVEKNKGRSVEKEAVISDQAIRSFRKIIESKRVKKEDAPEKEPVFTDISVSEKKNSNQLTGGKMLHFLYGASTFLVMTILVIGITMIHNYDKMKEMEQTMAHMTESTLVSGNSIYDENGQGSTGTKTTIIDVKTGETELLEGGIRKESETVSTEQESEKAAAVQETVQNDRQAGEASEKNSSLTDQAETEAATQSGEDKSQTQTASAPVHVSQASYTVKFGDTLADICTRYYGSTEKLQEICELNDIEDANSILPGQKLVLP